MKTTLLFLICMILLITHGFTQNYIIAGQSSGNYIHYTDYNPDSIINFGLNNHEFKIDLDQNGIDDLLFSMGGITIYFPNYLRTWSTIKLLNDKINISLRTDSTNWIHRISIMNQES